MLAAVPFFKRWAVRDGKARAYRMAMIGAAAYFPALGLIGLVPGVPDGIEAVTAIFIAGLPTAGVYLFPGVITADIIDYDATRTDTRREALFYGAQNTLEKLATAVGPLIFAVVLLAGDSREDPAGIRLIGPVAGILVLLAYLSFRKYSLREQDEDGGRVEPAST
jgi:Na+/melibiose symporter-like transporter